MKKFITILLCIVLMTSIFSTGCKKKESEENNEKQTNTISEENNETEEIDYVLYLRHKDMPFLLDERYSINSNDEKLKDKSIEEFVINELMAFESAGEYVNAIPKGTKLLSVEKDGKIVTVNLSKEFVEGQKGESSDTLVTLAGIVNSITIMQDNEKVQFMIDGEIVDKINGIDVSKSFEYMEGFYPDK